MAFLSDGGKMWQGILLVVLAWDVPCLLSDGQTGSDWFRLRFEEHPLVVGGCVLLLVCHLIGRPRRLARYDPIGLLGHSVRLGQRAWRTCSAAGQPS